MHNAPLTSLLCFVFVSVVVAVSVFIVVVVVVGCSGSGQLTGWTMHRRHRYHML